VKAFQSAKGLVADGIVGPKTWSKLGITVSGTPTTPPSTGGVRGNPALANNARAVALSMGGYSSQGLCATGVSRAIQNTYGIKVWGNGNDIDDNLPRNKFRQVNLSLAEALKIPGLVLTWEKTSTRLGSIYGHTAITSGDGRSSYSDFVESNTLGAGGRSGFKVFMPI
jgi:peptidoglycan hydrolase-like protein with peptidoglycan-binding domain